MTQTAETGGAPACAPAIPDAPHDTPRDTPRDTRFRPGRTGNARGAPRRPAPRTAQVEKVLSRTWPGVDGEPRPMGEVLVAHVAGLAMAGEPWAMKEMLALMASVEKKRDEEARRRADSRRAREETQGQARDRAELERLRARLAEAETRLAAAEEGEQRHAREAAQAELRLKALQEAARRRAEEAEGRPDVIGAALALGLAIEADVSDDELADDERHWAPGRGGGDLMVSRWALEAALARQPGLLESLPRWERELVDEAVEEAEEGD